MKQSFDNMVFEHYFKSKKRHYQTVRNVFLAGALLIIAAIIFYQQSSATMEADEDHAAHRVFTGGIFARLFGSGTGELMEPMVARHQAVSDHIATSLGSAHLPDSRPIDCSDYVMRPGLVSGNLKSIVVVILPVLEPVKSRLKADLLLAYETTLASVYETTDFYYHKMEIAIMADAQHLGVVEALVEPLKKIAQPKLSLIRPTSSDRLTLFQDLLDLMTVSEMASNEYFVFVTAGQRFNKGWLEGLLTPFLDMNYGRGEIVPAQPWRQPVITVPHFDFYDVKDRAYWAQQHFVRLLFTWKLEPMWYRVPFDELLDRYSEADPIFTPVFLPHTFAVKRSSKLFDDLLALLLRDKNEPTTLEASQAIFRCLDNAAVYIAVCSRVGSPYVHGHRSTFDPKLIGKTETVAKSKVKFLSSWLDDSDYRQYAIAALQLQKMNIEPTLTNAKCMNFGEFSKQFGKDMIKPVGHQAAGNLKSKAGRCFRLSVEQRLVADTCDIISNTHVVYLTTDGALKTASGRCLSKVDGHFYLEARDCGLDKFASAQRWSMLPSGMIRLFNSTRCVSHNTDPDPAFKDRQILMIGECDENDANFQHFEITYPVKQN